MTSGSETARTPPNPGEHCACGAYPGGACDGWCYAKSYTNFEVQLKCEQIANLATKLEMQGRKLAVEMRRKESWQVACTSAQNALAAAEEKRREDVRKLEEECTEYWAFIAGIAHYFGCADGVDMRDFIMKELDKLKASAVRGEALARTVMADQISDDRAPLPEKFP